MTEQMAAWEVHDGVLRFGRVVRPQPDHGEVLVRVALAGICGSDVAKLTKESIPDPGHPWRPGHEIVGWHLGDAAADEPGQPVVVNPLLACGECDRCRAGQVNVCPGLRMIGWHRPGGFAEYVVVPRANVMAVPPGLDATYAVLAEPAAVAVHGVRCGLADRTPGRLAVVGSGALAVASAEYAASQGWDATVFVRGENKRAALTGSVKATVALLAHAPHRHFDAVIDAAGGRDDSPFVAALDLVRDGGVIVVQTSYYPGVRLSRDLREPIRRALTIVGSFTYCRHGGVDDFAVALDLLAASATSAGWPARYVGDRYPLQDLPAALAAVHRGERDRPFKAVLQFADIRQEGTAR